TLSRLLLTVLFVLALNSSWHYARTSALIIFLIAGLTDFIDGEIARRYGVITNFGKLMDPLVDKIMMAAAFISLVPLKAVPAWAATTVGAREFLISCLGMDYRSTDELFRSWLYVAEPGTDRAGSIAGNGNRTRMASLEGWNFTIKLCPHGIKSCRAIRQTPTHFSASRP